jgi:hypothetical protein
MCVRRGGDATHTPPARPVTYQTMPGMSVAAGTRPVTIRMITMGYVRLHDEALTRPESFFDSRAVEATFTSACR